MANTVSCAAKTLGGVESKTVDVLGPWTGSSPGAYSVSFTAWKM